MNERIKELAELSGIHPCNFEPDADIKVPLEMFAELIVAECSKVIVNGGYWSGGPLGPKRQCTPPEIAQMIKEHFGVEE